jgi:hypothetical protein
MGFAMTDCLAPGGQLSAGYRQFARPFDDAFRSGNHCVSATAQQYLCGLMQADKRNMERMAEAVPDSDDQVLQNFLTHSSWDHRVVMDQVARNTNARFKRLRGLSLDRHESPVRPRNVTRLEFQ